MTSNNKNKRLKSSEKKYQKAQAVLHSCSTGYLFWEFQVTKYRPYHSGSLL